MANKTISDLRELSTVSDNNVLVVETNAETFKVTKENLLKEVNTQLNTKSNVKHTHDEYVTESELNAKGYATETFVTNKIEEASLSGTVDLSGYYTKTEVDDLIDDIPTHQHDNKDLLDGITVDAISKWSSTDASTISGYSIVVLTEEEYNELGTIDGNTIYIVKGLE